MTTRVCATAVVAGLVLLSGFVQAEEDAHDKLVYSHYSKKFQPTAYKVDRENKQAQLDRPATRKDVESGKAIFSFEGLGEARVWKLPGDEFPIQGALSTARPRGTQYAWPPGTADVCQAEELKVGGKWKRYFGFLSEEGAAVVPAEEMELLVPDCPWYTVEELFADVFWGITRPGPKPGFWKRIEDETPKVGDPLPVELHVSNTTKLPLNLPAIWYKAGNQGGPGLLDAVTISLEWAPFDPGHPVRRESIPVEPIRKTRFSPDGRKVAVKPGDSRKLLTLDLRDWFKVEREGYYTVTLEVDGKALGLHDKLAEGVVCSRTFTIGKEPRLPSIAEFNKTQPAIGGQANEGRLKRVIKESIQPRRTEHKPLPADVERLLAWSEPVGGLAARIEYVWAERTIFVRLKNTSGTALVVPAGNSGAADKSRGFEVLVRQGERPWRQATADRDNYYAPPSPDSGPSGVDLAHGTRGRPADRPPVTLGPGEDCLAVVTAFDEPDSGEAKIVKVVLRRPGKADGGQWSGVLETPPRPMELSPEQARLLIGAVPPPSHFPPLTYDSSGFVSMGPMASAVQGLHGPNRPLIDMLEIYDPPGVRREFERRMQAEKILPTKLLLASVAAWAGSEEAALFLLETMRGTDYATVANLHYALWITYWRYWEGPPGWQRKEPPDWLVELSMAVLSDHRMVTGLEKTNLARGTSFTVASCGTGDLEFALCDSHCRKAVPLLIERLKKGLSGSYTAVMLGEMGDQRAVPVLIELVERAGKTAEAEYSKGYGLSEEFSRPAYALGELKAREAVPLLLRYIEFPEIISDLGDIGDPRAVPVLQGLVSARGKITRDGKDVYPKLEQERLFTAKVALAGFDRENGVVRLGEMLSDESLTVHQRYEVAMSLGRRHDQRAIPYLVKAIKTESRYQPTKTMESRHYLIDMAISGLSGLKYKASVEGLIECFDVPFKKEDLGMGGRVTPATYRNDIAHSLQKLTGQPFGADKQQWLKWWQEKGKASAELK